MSNTLTLRLLKGVSLTQLEMDDNFRLLLDKANTCIPGQAGDQGPQGLMGSYWSIDAPLNPDTDPISKVWIQYDPDNFNIIGIWDWKNNNWIENLNQD